MSTSGPTTIHKEAWWRRGIDRRLIFLFVGISLTLPLLFDLTMRPAPMRAAEALFAEVDRLQAAPGKLVFIAADWGPGTQGENKPQTMLVMEHLLRKRVPFALISLYQLASPMLKELPEEVLANLKKDLPNETWEYGKDWVNLGYQPSGLIAVQNMAKAENIQTVLKADANLTPLADLPITKEFHSLRDVQMLVQITGLVGVFNSWLQFFQTEGYSPPMVHGCTSISIPDAYLYYASKQIVGFFEGVAGAAWYDELLSKHYPNREEVAKRVNTGLAYAQLLILALVVLGNLHSMVSSNRVSSNKTEAT